MATAARQNKPARKGAPEPARRIPAWTGARASPTYTPPPNAPTRTQGAASPVTGNFPPLAQANGSRADAVQDRVLQSLSGLTGTTVTVCTKTSQRYEGVIASTGGEGDTTGVTLKDVKEISSPGAPLKDQLFIASTNIDTWSSGPADAKPPNGDSFRTDTDISQRKGAGRERELQQWSAGPDAVPATDDDTFGPLNNTSWDQFAVNEKLFGVKTNFDENLYTTKLDRSAADFKERERNAQRIANEIIGATSSNPHIAEERNQTVDDSGINEEDKYGAVVRGTNAYVPPGARKPGALSPPVNNAAAAPTTAKVAADIPKVSVNGPDGAKLPSLTQSPSSSKAPSPAPVTKPADALPAFRDFVTNEKQRLTQKRQALVKNEMDKRMAELVKFSQNFKLNKPIPDDLVPILAKDEEKQRAIREKATKDAASAQARTIGATTPANAARGAQVAAAKISGPQRPALTPAAKTATNSVAPAQASVASKFAASTKPTPTSEAAAKKPSMFIQAIPPFKGAKARQSSGPAPANGAPAANAATPPSASGSANAGNMSPATAANRLNVNASSFRPNAKANAFTPGAAPPNNAAAASASVSPKPKPETTPNPFFGTRPIKKSQLVNIKDDFNPFKHNKVVEAAQISGLWPYNGKRYAQMFPQPQHQPQHQQPHNMPAPGPPPIPPPSYEEDSAAQAAARGYVYAYPPYGYPGQPMMPSMAPPGPPGAYMPGPYMQPMQYPPGMPPPNAMYTPAMGQMPPQAYMPPPPPGPPYPPPNGAGPRPSVPSTPMPAHVHQYYHQSPQRMIPFDQYTGKMFTMPMPTVQHAVPYHMMMPPPNVPQHPYDGGPAPPVQMGGHA